MALFLAEIVSFFDFLGQKKTLTHCESFSYFSQAYASTVAVLSITTCPL